jgi:hypothetical protein
LKNGIVTLNIPNKSDIKLVVMHINQNLPSNSEGAIIELNETAEKSSKKNKIFSITLNEEMSGTDPQSGKPIEISVINALALYNSGKKTVSFNSENKVDININFQ